MTSRLDHLLADALQEVGERIDPSPDLFARIQRGVVADRQRRIGQRRWLVVSGIVAAPLLGSLAAFTYRQGEPQMNWWVLELATFVLLVAIALTLGPFIKRFGRSYAADVFRSNPSTGKSFIVLTDFAYYLIFSAYILFSTTIDRPRSWGADVGAVQIEHTIIRLGGILLIIGLLHGVNLLVLPIIGRLLTLNRRLDQQMRETAARDLGARDFDQPQFPDSD